MSRKSSIHFKPVSNVRFAVSHSERTDLSEPAYLLPKEYQLANILIPDSLPENDLAALFIQQQTGMSRQAKTAGSSPFWEGVVVLPNTNGPEQTTNLKAWKKEYEAVTGHKVLHMSIHLDEGYIDTAGVPQYNPHAHVIVSRMDAKNRVIHLDRSKLAGVQDLTAKTLQMERGSTLDERKGYRGRTHIEHREFRKLADEKRVQLDVEKAETARIQKISQQWSDNDLDKIKALKKELAEAEAEAKKVPELEAQLEGEPARLEAALKAQEAQLNEGYRLDRERMKQENADALVAGLEKMHSQKDYQALKTEHAEALADLKTELARAAQQAAKVPSLEAQIAQLTPLAEQVPDLVATVASQADQIAQLQEKYKLDREEFKRLNAEAAADGMEKVKTQQDYQDLKTTHLGEIAVIGKAHAEQLEGLKTELAKTQTEAKKVPELVAEAVKAKHDEWVGWKEKAHDPAKLALSKSTEKLETMTTKITELEAAKLEADKTRFADMAKAYQDGKEAGTPAHLIVPIHGVANPPSPSTRGGETSLPPSGERIQSMRERLQEASKQATEAPKAPSHPIAPPAPEKSLQEALKDSWDAFVDWIKGVGGVHIAPTENGLTRGAILQMDSVHCIQKSGRENYTIHLLDNLDLVPDMNNKDTTVQYREGIGHVGGNGQTPRPLMR